MNAIILKFLGNVVIQTRHVRNIVHRRFFFFSPALFFVAPLRFHQPLVANLFTLRRLFLASLAVLGDLITRLVCATNYKLRLC